MVKPKLKAWSIQDVAHALQCHHMTLNKMWHRYNIGETIRGTRIYQPPDVHHAAWLLWRWDFHGQLPWAHGEPRRLPRVKLYSTDYVARLFAWQVGYLSELRNRYPALGLRVGAEVVFTNLDIALLKDRAKNHGRACLLDTYVADPERAKIKLDKKVLMAYDNITSIEEEIMKEPRGKPGSRTRNLVSVYLTDELKAWLDEYRRDVGYLSKSQAINHALTKYMKNEPDRRGV